MVATAYDVDGNVVASRTVTNGSYDFLGTGLVKRLVFSAPVPMPPDESWRPGVAIDFVYDFEVPCPPTGDPVLDDVAVRDALRNELLLSRPNWETGVGRKERRGFIFRRDDGSHFLEPLDDPNATMCETGIPGLPPIPVIPGATFVGEYHTHPSKHREPVTGCRGQKPGEDRRANRKLRVGGGSDADWDYATVRGSSMYVIDYDHKVWRLDANTLEGSPRSNNQNRWKYGEDNNCLKRI